MFHEHLRQGETDSNVSLEGDMAILRYFTYEIACTEKIHYLQGSIMHFIFL